MVQEVKDGIVSTVKSNFQELKGVLHARGVRRDKECAERLRNFIDAETNSLQQQFDVQRQVFNTTFSRRGDAEVKRALGMTQVLRNDWARSAIALGLCVKPPEE